MGHERERNALLKRQEMEALRRDAGEMIDFGAHSDGCPTCGDPRIEVVYHLGSKLGPSSDCNLSGPHLHCTSGCGKQWITRCKDDPENAERAPAGIDLMHAMMRAIAASFPEGLIVEHEQLRASSGGSVFIDEVEGGKKLVYVPRS